MKIGAAPFSGKGLAPFLHIKEPDRAEACRRVTSLFVNMRNAKKNFAAANHVLEPLLALLPHDRCAAGPLATMAPCLWGDSAYPEALACIDAVIDLSSDEPLGNLDEPWHYHSLEKMTWPRQQALLWMMRGECRLAAGDREGGEAALAEAARRAVESGVPEPLGLTGARSPYQGTLADARLLSLVDAARALRLRFEGKDASFFRKVKKPKPGAMPDPALLSMARRYLDDALAVIGPRAAEQYAGLVPDPQRVHPALTRAHKDYAWQKRAYLESALVDEHLGETARAKLHLGRAKWISALFDPSHRWEDELCAAVARLGAESAPLA